MAVIESERFSVIRELGSGGMGVVFEALDKRTDQTVALKTVHHATGQNLYRIKQEFRALADIEHTNLVRLRGLFEERGQWFFAMERVVGTDFRDYVGWQNLGDTPSVTRTATGDATIGGPNNSEAHSSPALVDGQARPLNEARLRDCTAQIVAGLSHLHGLGRIHCDLKPSNVMVTSEGRVVILDFGLTQSTDENQSATRGRLEGTVPYMAPEQARGEAPTAGTDYYALGVMLYEVLTGERPFVGSEVQILAEKQRRRATPPKTLNSGVPDGLNDLCMGLLEPDVSLRAGPNEVLAALGPTPDSTRRPAASAVSAGTEVFVGRGDELSRLGAAVGRNRDVLRAVLLRGEAGVGKSALARTFLTQQRDAGALVLSSRCREQETVPLKAFDGMIDALSRHLMGLDEVSAALLLPTDVTSLVQVFPVLDRVPVVSRLSRTRASGSASDEQRRRAAISMRLILQGIARETSLLLFIDDMQWADEASLAFLADLLDEHEPLSAFVLATTRPTTEAGKDPFTRLCAHSATWAEKMEVWTLAGLESDDAAELLQRSGGSSLSTEQSRSLVSDSDGHPLLLKELARYLASGGAVGDNLSLTDALTHRIGALSGRDRSVLSAVCLAGSPVELPVVATSLGMPVADCDYSVHCLKGAQLLRIGEQTGRQHRVGALSRSDPRNR